MLTFIIDLEFETLNYTSAKVKDSKCSEEWCIYYMPHSTTCEVPCYTANAMSHIANSAIQLINSKI